jgi:hypothetical protein
VCDSSRQQPTGLEYNFFHIDHKKLFSSYRSRVCMRHIIALREDDRPPLRFVVTVSLIWFSLLLPKGSCKYFSRLFDDIEYIQNFIFPLFSSNVYVCTAEAFLTCVVTIMTRRTGSPQHITPVHIVHFGVYCETAQIDVSRSSWRVRLGLVSILLNRCVISSQLSDV